jgi:tetratricopeptide (TPR) repeat protein/transcriptional regulator with XRE-family HTH domain
MDAMTTADVSSFGDLLRRYREAAGLTQAALAERAGLSTRGISALERGQRRLPQRATVELLARALALAPHELARLTIAVRAPDGTAPAPVRPGRPRRRTPRQARVAQPGPPLIGRSRELVTIDRHLGGEGPPLLMFAGEPGIGKSRLLTEAAARARQYGWQVLAGGCQRGGGQGPYAPLLQALEAYVARLPLAALPKALAGCAWLVPMLPELTSMPIESLPDWNLPPAQERRLMFRAVGRFLANVAQAAGTLLVLDDLQWSDEDGMDLLMFLLRSPGPAPVRVIGAYRDSDVNAQHPLALQLADLAREQLLEHQSLGPLATSEVSQLLDSLLPESTGPLDLREQILNRTGGVPYFVVSFAQELLAGAPTPAASLPVPWSLGQSIRQRLALLPESSRTLLGAAAVIGRQAPIALLCAVSAQPEEGVVEGLDSARRGRLLEEDIDGYRFTHDVICEVLREDLGAARRAVLHRKVGLALEQSQGEAPVELLSYHYARSSDRDKAALYLEQAGDQAHARFALAAAAGHYRELVNLLDRMRRVAQAAAARLKLGTVLRVAAHYDEALAVLEQAAATFDTVDDLENLGRAVAEIGQVHGLRGTPEEGIRRIQPLLETLETTAQGTVGNLADMYVALALPFFMSGRVVEQLAATERAMALARAAGDPRVLAEAHWMHGLALFTVGRFEEAQQVNEDAVRLCEATGSLYALSHVLNNAGEYARIAGDFAVAGTYYERARAVSEQLGDPTQLVYLTANRSLLAFQSGDWEEAQREADHMLTMSRRIGLSWAAPIALLMQGQLYLARGEWATARQYLEEAIGMAEPSGSLDALRGAEAMLAELDLLDERPAAAIARLLPLLDRPGLEEPIVTTMLPLLAWAYLELGDERRAEQMLTQTARRVPAQLGPILFVEILLRVRAMLKIRQGRWAEAEAALEEAEILARAMPHPYAEARLLQVHGQMRSLQGTPDQARTQLGAALAIFRRLGARKDAERVERLLIALP